MEQVKADATARLNELREGMRMVRTVAKARAYVDEYNSLKEHGTDEMHADFSRTTMESTERLAKDPNVDLSNAGEDLAAINEGVKEIIGSIKDSDLRESLMVEMNDHETKLADIVAEKLETEDQGTQFVSNINIFNIKNDLTEKVVELLTTARTESEADADKAAKDLAAKNLLKQIRENEKEEKKISDKINKEQGTMEKLSLIMLGKKNTDDAKKLFAKLTDLVSGGTGKVE